MLDFFKTHFERVCKYPIQIDYKNSEFCFHPQENSQEVIKVILDISAKFDLAYNIYYHKQHGIIVEFN